MKKLISLLVALMMTVSVFAFAACGGDNNNNNNKPATTDELNVKGSIDGNYAKVELNSESYDSIVEKFDDPMPAVTKDGEAGGNGELAGEIKFTVGGKSVTLSADAALALILDIAKINGDDAEGGLSAIGGMALNSELGLKGDAGFAEALWNLIAPMEYGDQYPSLSEVISEKKVPGWISALTLLNNLNLNVKSNAYITDNKVYGDTQITGIPDAVKDLLPEGMSEYVDLDQIIASLSAGLKYSIDEDQLEMIVDNYFSGMLKVNDETVHEIIIDFDDDEIWGETITEDSEEWDDDEDYQDLDEYPDYEEWDDDEDYQDLDKYPDYEEWDDEDWYGDEDGMGVNGIEYYFTMLDLEMSSDGNKVKFATTATTKDKVGALIKAQVNGDMAEVIKDIAISKLDIAIYVEFNDQGEITAVAGEIDVAVSATFNGTAISLSVKGAGNVSFAVPASITYPSFTGYEDYLTVISGMMNSQAK